MMSWSNSMKKEKFRWRLRLTTTSIKDTGLLHPEYSQPLQMPTERFFNFYRQTCRWSNTATLTAPKRRSYQINTTTRRRNFWSNWMPFKSIKVVIEIAPTGKLNSNHVWCKQTCSWFCPPDRRLHRWRSLRDYHYRTGSFSQEKTQHNTSVTNKVCYGVFNAIKFWWFWTLFMGHWKTYQSHDWKRSVN